MMLYLYGLLIVSWISFGSATTTPAPTHNERSNEHRFERAIDSTYVIEIDPDSSEAVDNETCHPTPNKPSTVPCKSLDYAFQQNYGISNSITFLLVSPNSTYTLTTNATFQDLNGISIVGNSSTTDLPVVVKCTTPNSGLAFLHSNRIEIRYVRFVGCGAVHNSTSRDFTVPTMQMIPINVTLYFYNCSDVNMSRVEVFNSSQATGVVMYDTNGQIQVTECTFFNNSAENGTLGGGGFAVEFTYCSPGNTSCPNDFREYDPGYRRVKVPAEYNFTDCHFEKNVARSQSYTSSAGNLIFASLADHTAIGRGGGLSIYFKGIAKNKSININNCNFTNNSAVWGGGLLIEMDDNTITNKVKISHCTFIANHAFFHDDYGTGGGAIRIAITLYFWSDAYQRENSTRNEILIQHSNFTKNKAIQGGAMSFSIARQRLSYLSQVTHLLVSDSTFDRNVAQLGSAVFGTLYPIFSEGFIAPLNFSSCYFLSNHVSNRLYEKNRNDLLRSHPAGMGAVYVNELPTTFSNLAHFSTNHGSALAVVGTSVNFSGTHAFFHNNSGSSGGALALLGASSILTGPNTKMTFFDNSASIHGGAVYNRYISKEDLTSSVNCFFRYIDPFISPFNWSAEFMFYGNVATKLGNSIYSTAALPCSWARPSAGKDKSNIFCNKQQWHFFYSNCTKEVYTEARKMQLRKDAPSQIEAFPGHGFFLLLDAFDDFGHNVTNDTVYAASIQSSDAEVEPTYAYVAHNYIAITGKPGVNVDMSMYTAGSRTMYIMLNLTLQQCPPGFHYTHDNRSDTEGDHSQRSSRYEEDLDKYTSCTCPPSNVTQFRGKLYCLADEFWSQIQNQYWIGTQNQTYNFNDSENYQSELLMGLVPRYYTTNAPYGDEYINLPQNFSSLNDFICGGGNRSGTLCGQCRDGYAVAINSRIYECVPCKNISISERAKTVCIYLALTYFPILSLFFVIIIFNFKLTSSAALSFVLFAQMIGSGVYSLTAGEAFYLKNPHVNRMEKAYTTIYGFFNLNSLAFLMEPFCIDENLTTLHVLTLEYVVAAFPIAMIIIIYLGYRCCTIKCECYERRRRARQAERADPSSTSTTQSTDKAHEQQPRNTLIHAFVAFLFLSYTKFSLASMFTMSLTELFGEDGTSHGTDYIYFAGHMRFRDREYLLRYGLPAVFILIFIVILLPLLLLGPIQFIDWLIDKRGFRWLQRLWPSIKVHTFLDTFQGFYKPNRRFFSGIYFLFRLAVFLNFSFSKTLMGQYIFQQIAVTVLIVLVALFRPYKRDFYNYLDVLILCNLSILNAFAIYIFTNRFSSFPYRVYVVECILVWLPLIYILCYAVWNRMHHRKQYSMVKAKVIRLVNPARFSQGDVGTNEEHEQLLGNNQDLFDDKSLDEPIHINEDPDERLFRRASRRNRYRSANQNNINQQSPGADSRAAPGRPGSVSSMVVSIWEEESAAEKDLMKHDSGTGTGTGTGTSTGRSSTSGFNSNDS